MIEEIYNKLLIQRKLLVKPYCLPKEEFISEWYKYVDGVINRYGTNTYAYKNEIQTEKGEIVRSKSEKAIADKLFMMGIPYRYEAPLVANDKKFFPDFTVLNINTRQTLYWEHFGMVDEEEYKTKSLIKLEEYSRAGIYPGKNLIISTETEERPLVKSSIERIIDRYLKM